ncbi:jg1546 [Pararge aegeria aegeria]|uniref:Jg1546 protein n=1 Tax=Pararge aegeria aegeria TaxID=348720 RepID=A0A8S4QSA3_9NEOP|nr:jg1546 [Pararge aegeria aegeria]
MYYWTNALVEVELFVTELVRGSIPQCLFQPRNSIVSMLCPGLKNMVAGVITVTSGLTHSPWVDGHRAACCRRSSLHVLRSVEGGLANDCESSNNCHKCVLT